MSGGGAVARERDLRALRAWYLVYFAGQYAQNFLPLVLGQVMGFSEAEIGGLVGLRRLATMLSAPLFTALCDRTRRHRALLLAGMACYYALCAALATESALALVAATLLAREMCGAGADATVNAAAVATLAEVAAQADREAARPPPAYGSLRLYGSLGWGAMSFLGAFLVDRLFRADMRFVLFSQAAIGVVVLFLIASVLNLSPELFARAAERRAAAVAAAAAEAAARGGGDGGGSGRVVDWEWVAEVGMFAANVLMVGISAGVLQMSLFLYLTTLGVANSVLGLAIMYNCAVEACGFLLHGRIAAALGGPVVAFRLSLVTNSINLAALANIHRTSNPAAAYVACMTVGGVSFPLFWASAVQICAMLAPPGMETSAQGALYALNWGFGAALGSVVAGIGMQKVGTPRMYVIVSLVQLSVMGLPFGMWTMLRRFRKRLGYSEIPGTP